MSISDISGICGTYFLLLIHYSIPTSALSAGTFSTYYAIMSISDITRICGTYFLLLIH